MENEKQLFDEFIALAEKIRAMGSVVQNDTRKMIKDGTINGDDIEEAIRTFISSFHRNSTDFQTLYNKTVRHLCQMQRLAEVQEAKLDTTPPLWVNINKAKPAEVDLNEKGECWVIRERANENDPSFFDREIFLCKVGSDVWNHDVSWWMAYKR